MLDTTDYDKNKVVDLDGEEVNELTNEIYKNTIQ